jgi:hypothetical protein
MSDPRVTIAEMVLDPANYELVAEFFMIAQERRRLEQQVANLASSQQRLAALETRPSEVVKNIDERKRKQEEAVREIDN